MRVPYLLIAWALLCSPLARGDPWQYELLLMPSAQAVGTFNRTAPVTEIVDEVVQVDTLFTVQRGSAYLRLFPMFVRQRDVIGLRWDFVRRQALTLQLSHTNTLQGHFSDIRLQWSAAFL